MASTEASVARVLPQLAVRAGGRQLHLVVPEPQPGRSDRLATGCPRVGADRTTIDFDYAEVPVIGEEPTGTLFVALANCIGSK